jgi:alkylhydroperoxidase family enzyme
MRIRGLERNEARFWLRPLFSYLAKRFGKTPTPFKVWARRPGALLGLAGLMTALERSKLVDAKLKRLANIRAAQIVGCPF